MDLSNIRPLVDDRPEECKFFLSTTLFQNYQCTDSTTDKQKKAILKTDPKLCRFPGRYEELTFVDFLGYGVQGYVFKALYQGKFVAIKLFRRYVSHNPSNGFRYQYSYYSPFANECRALARLVDLGKDGTVSAPCLGWWLLNYNEGVKLIKTYVKGAREGLDELYEEYTQCSPWRCIVKGFVPELPESEERLEQQYNLDRLKNQAIFYSCGIQLDGEELRPDNYRQTLLVDLGNTATIPNPQRINKYSWDCFRRSYQGALDV